MSPKLSKKTKYVVSFTTKNNDKKNKMKIKKNKK